MQKPTINFGAQQKRKQQAALQQQLGTNAPVLFDRFSRPIMEDCAVVFHPGFDLEYRVVSITPDLSPEAPKGAVKVLLQAQIELPCRAGVALQPLITVRMPDRLMQDAHEEESLDGSHIPPATDDPSDTPITDSPSAIPDTITDATGHSGADSDADKQVT